MDTSKNRSRYLQVQVASPFWAKQKGLVPHLNKVTALVLHRLSALLGEGAKRAQVSLLLTSDEAVRKLNVQFRGFDKTTNVLSFPQFTRRELRGQGPSGGELYPVGDIAFSSLYVAQEAKAEGKNLKNHATHLLIHGILHLFGYDHMTDRAAREMEGLETSLMAELGLPDPYGPEGEIKGRKSRLSKTK